MKKSSYFILVLFTVLSCSKKKQDDQQVMGTIHVSIGLSVSVSEVYSKIKSAQPDEFIVAIYQESGELFTSFNRAVDMPETVQLPIGNYYAEAYSDNNLPAAFENDYYYGSSSEFEVAAGATESVAINCSLGNVMLSVIYSEQVKADFTDYSTTVSNSDGLLVFESDETRAGFFNEGPLDIAVSLYFPDGSGGMSVKNLATVIENPEKGKHYEIHVDGSLSDGGASLNLLVDETYDTEVISLTDEVDPGPIAYGDLLITEIMYNPDSLSDSEGEWIEIYNNSGSSINLNQLVLVRYKGEDYHTIEQDISLDPAGYAILARSTTACNNVSYTYGSAISLPNTGEEIRLINYGTDGTNGSTICAVDYGAENFNTGLAGASLQLSSLINTASEAMDGLNWCASIQEYSTGDLGSPGVANNTCD